MSVMPSSPFKFLDAYGAEDSKTFFGREAEIEALYTLVVKSRLVLVYGPSGSGKTSLIQCGLANRFKPTDWFPVFVRRGEDLNASLQQRINALATTPIDPADDIVAAARSLYLDFYRPLYFIFDQFEELFILGEPGEDAKFFASIQALLSSDLNCKIIISMREEYIALLQNFEAAVPTLFHSRQRVEQMTLGTVREVIIGMTGAAGITLEHGAETAGRITEQIGDPRAGVQLAYLQVYLDRLFREAQKSATPLVFTDELVARIGKLGDVMAEFLEEQTQAIADDVRSRHPNLPKGAVHRVLEALTTVEGTKQPVLRGELGERLPELAPMLDELLAALERSRIIRQTDDIIEVSHDQLAKRIAERRSADSKALAQVQRLVRDRLAGHEQTRTFLAAEELAKVQPVLSQLGLSPAEAAFVDKSRVKLRWRRLRTIAATAGIIAILVVSLIFAVFSAWQSVETVEKAVQTTSAISETLAAEDDIAILQQKLLIHLKALISDLEEIDEATTGDTGFWLEIADGDIQQQNGEWSVARAKFEAARAKAATSRAGEAAEGVESDVDWLRNESIALSRLGSLSNDEAIFEESVDKAQQLLDRARNYYRQSLAIDEGQRQRKPLDPDVLHDLMLSHGALAYFEFNNGKDEAARESALAAVTVGRELEALVKTLPDAAADPEYAAEEAAKRRSWAVHHAEYQALLGEIDWYRGKYDGARDAYVEAAAVYSRIVPADRASRIATIRNYFGASDAARAAGQWEKALALHNMAKAEFGRLEKKVPKQAGTRGSVLNDSVWLAWKKLLEKQRQAIDARDAITFEELPVDA
jgi:hypothetical protein